MRRKIKFVKTSILRRDFQFDFTPKTILIKIMEKIILILN